MKVTGWTSWGNDSFIELSQERWKYYNKDKNLSSISPQNVKLYAKEHNLSNDEAAEYLLNEYRKIPMWTNEEEVLRLEGIHQQVYDAVLEYCAINHIFITDYEHQGELWGVPVVDNKYRLELSLRMWSGLMAEVWNKILGIDTLGYLDFYCRGPGDIKDFNKPLDVLNR